MRALQLQPGRKLKLVHKEGPRVTAPNHVLVRVVQSGICGTDRSVLVGKFNALDGVTLGHESVGVVAQVGSSVDALQVGDRVVVNPTLYCGECSSCRAGRLNFCDRKRGSEVGIDLDGTFADEFRIEARFLHKIPDGMDFDRAVMIEPLVCALNNVRASRLEAGEHVAILGGGPMGTITAMLALHIGARVTLVEADPVRLELCREILQGIGSAPCRILYPWETPSVDGADVVIDAVGGLLDTALSWVRVGGRVVILGYDSRSTANVKPLDILTRGISVIGAGDYNSILFPQGIELARSLPLERLITERYPLESFDAAFERLSLKASSPYRAMKVLLVSSQARSS